MTDADEGGPSAVTDGGTANPTDESTVASLWTPFKAIFRKRIRLRIRYPLDFLGTIATIYLFFAIAFFGGRAAAQSMGATAEAIGETFDGIIVGWFLWTMAVTAYSSLANNVSLESNWGTLEQLYMSPYGFQTVFGAKVVVNVIEAVLWGGLLLTLMLVTTGRSLTIDLLTILPISILALASMVGIGFVFGGLALIYKRIQSINQLLNFVVVGLIAAPAASDVSMLNVLPLAQGSVMLQGAMREGVRLWEFPPLEFGLLIGTAVGYLVVGYAVFRYCAYVARARGVMGHY